MKILFVDPPGKNKGLNTGLAYLSAQLKDRHEVHVLDLNNRELGLCGDPNPEIPLDEVESKVLCALNERKPDLLGISVKTFTADVTRHILKVAKSQLKDMIIMVGGPHITLDGMKFVQETGVDFAVKWEGEYTTPKLCDVLEKNGNFDELKGILYWRDDHVVQMPPEGMVNNLDDIPFPCYDHFSSVIENGGQIDEYPILTSRGCVFRCSYCSMPKIMGNKWRSHSAERVVNELRHAKELYGISSFTVVDDNFTLNLERVAEICDLMISEEINLPWNSQNGIRADRITEDISLQMRRSGCRYVWVGVESADEEVFRSINKGEKLDDIVRGIRHLQKAKIQVGGFFITGLPGSSRDSDLKSVDFVKKLGIDAWWFNFVPYPFTEAWKWVQDHGTLLRPIDGALQYGAQNIEPVFETEDYPKAMRIETYNEIHIRMKYFDRLVDPSLRQAERWRCVYEMIDGYGLRTRMGFLLFVLKYNLRIAFKKIYFRQ